MGLPAKAPTGCSNGAAPLGNQQTPPPRPPLIANHRPATKTSARADFRNRAREQVAPTTRQPLYLIRMDAWWARGRSGPSLRARDTRDEEKAAAAAAARAREDEGPGEKTSEPK
jgi:hypothetical protein